MIDLIRGGENRQPVSQWQPDSSRVSATWDFWPPPHSSPERGYRQRAEDGPHYCPSRAPSLVGLQLHQNWDQAACDKKKIMASGLSETVLPRQNCLILVLFRCSAGCGPYHPQLETGKVCLLIFWLNSDHFVVLHLGFKICFFSTLHLSLLFTIQLFSFIFSFLSFSFFPLFNFTFLLPSEDLTACSWPAPFQEYKPHSVW